jgi:hypothetical protein
MDAYDLDNDIDRYNPSNNQFWRTMKCEHWAWVPGYEGIYQVSHRGGVRSADRIIYGQRKTTYARRHIKLMADKRGQGYLCWNSQDNGNKYAHRAVAEAFIGPPVGDRNEVDHIDGDAKNNCVWNLEWVTRAEQMRRAKERGVFSFKVNPKRANSHRGPRLTPAQIVAIQNDLASGMISKDVCDKYGICHMHAQKIKKGRSHYNASLTYPLGPTEALSGRALSERMGHRGALGFRGVSLDHGRYRARINVAGKTIALGTYDTFDEAKQARLDAEKKYWP